MPSSWWLVAGLVLAANAIGQGYSVLQVLRGGTREWLGYAISLAGLTVWLFVMVLDHAPLLSKALSAALWLLVLRDLFNSWKRRRRRRAASLAGYKARAVLARMRARAAAA